MDDLMVIPLFLQLFLNTTPKTSGLETWMSTGRPASSFCGTVPHCKHCRRRPAGRSCNFSKEHQPKQMEPFFSSENDAVWDQNVPYFPKFSILWFLPKSVSQDELFHLGAQACGGPAIVGMLGGNGLASENRRWNLSHDHGDLRLRSKMFQKQYPKRIISHDPHDQFTSIY